MCRNENTPGGEPRASQKCHCGDSLILQESTVTATDHAPDLPAFVVLMNTRNDRVRRYVYLSLHSAAAAVERARDRGMDAELVLCELRPTEAVIV